MRGVTVAPITSTVRGLSTEIPVGSDNGLDHTSVINCDAIETIDAARLLGTVGFLLDNQEHALAEAISNAFDLVT